MALHFRAEVKEKGKGKGQYEQSKLAGSIHSFICFALATTILGKPKELPKDDERSQRPTLPFKSGVNGDSALDDERD
ncbi:hypothetical protein LOK49_LG02G01519 [Camellia lanceoleosa]|uniref:Uncharacterized protein n=1 Tax=Camellia lanceoleosa TaxID=1840588 RepID=A0ACC0ITR3_9ERIC|nr:hypothetical protein LOK49_LG02G01519 [Camellia lanceoleosa]